MLNKKTEKKIKEAFSIFNNADSVVIEYQNVFPKIVISVGIKNIGYGYFSTDFRQRLELEMKFIVKGLIETYYGYYDGGVAIEIGCS